MDRQEKLLHQLFQTVRMISKGLNTILEPYGLYSSEWAIITTLNESGPLTQGTLSNYLSIEPPAVSRSLAKLEKKGLIIRISGADKREKKVSLSNEALIQYPQWLEVSRQHRHAVLADLPDEKHVELELLLKSICQSAQQYEQPHVGTQII
jgi:MarR family transcriptional regulator, transcriptional regulator for hemolysin